TRPIWHFRRPSLAKRLHMVIFRFLAGSKRAVSFGLMKSFFVTWNPSLSRSSAPIGLFFLLAYCHRLADILSVIFSKVWSILPGYWMRLHYEAECISLFISLPCSQSILCILCNLDRATTFSIQRGPDQLA